MDQRHDHRRGRLGVARIVDPRFLRVNDDVEKPLVHAIANAKINTWNCPIVKSVIALCRAGTPVLTADLCRRLIDGYLRRPVCQLAPQNLRIAVFFGSAAAAWIPASVLAFVAGRRRLLTWLRGMEPRIQSLVPWHLSLKAHSTATVTALIGSLNAWAWVSVNCGACSFSIWERRLSPLHRRGECFSQNSSYTKLGCQ